MAYNAPVYGATNASASVYRNDSYSSSDDEDDDKEIGDQFADFGSAAFADTFRGNTEDFADFPDISAEGQRPFEANFDTSSSVPTASFEANFDEAPAATGADFFAAFPTDVSVDVSAGFEDVGFADFPTDSSSGACPTSDVMIGDDLIDTDNTFDPFGTGAGTAANHNGD
jgi:hypothetical protein